MLSIVIPAYNEEKRIGNTLERYGKFFQDLKKHGKIKDFELLIVLNGCKDNTIEVVKKFKDKFKEIRYLDFEEGGKGFAIIQGFKDAFTRKNELIGYVDADLATSPEAFYDLVKNIKNYNGIIASRGLKNSKVNVSFSRKLTNRGFNFVVRSFLFLPYKDTQCLPSFSEVFVEVDGKAVKDNIEKIKDYMDLKLVEKGKDFKLYNVKNNVKIPSLNKKTKKIEHVPVTGFVVRKNKDKKLIKISLEGGRTFFVSENHPLMMFNGNKFYQKSADKLKEGDLLPIVKKWDINLTTHYLDLINYIKEKDKLNIKVCGWKKILNIKPSEIARKLDISFDKTYSWYLHDRMPVKYYLMLEKNSKERDKLSLCFKGGKHTIPARIKISKELLRLLGYYISEGCCTMFDSKKRSRHSIRISFNKNETDFIEETKDLFNKLFEIQPKLEKQESCITINVFSRILCYLFKEIFRTGTKAHNKRIPMFIYNLDKEKIGNFIDTYFLGDGHISLHKQANSIIIRANSASEKLIKDLQLLLLRLGITSNVRVSKRKNTVMGRKIKDFKKDKWHLRIHAGSNIKKFEEFCPLIRKNYKSLFSEFKNKNPSFYERKVRDIENSDMCLAKIKKIGKKKYFGKWYDFKIQSDEKPYENFMHDSGILSHNCGAKLFKKQALESVIDELGITKWAFDIDLLFKLRRKRFKIREIPTIWEDIAGSKIDLIRVPILMFLSIVRLRLLNSWFKSFVRLYDKIPEFIKIHHKLR